MKPLKPKPAFAITTIEGRIHLVRGHKIILDHDLAELYGVSTKALNQAMKRNSQRFPDEFVFRLTQEEENSLRSQFVTLTDSAGARDSIPNQSQIVTGSLEASSVNILRSQIVTSKETRGGRRYLPFAFTEHGVLMAANVLRSLGRRRIVFCDSPDAEWFACDGRDVTFSSVVPLLRFEASGSKVNVIDCSAFATVAMPPSQRPIIA